MGEDSPPSLHHHLAAGEEEEEEWVTLNLYQPPPNSSTAEGLPQNGTQMFNSAIFIRLLALSRLLDFQSVFCLFIYGFILFLRLTGSLRMARSGLKW